MSLENHLPAAAAGRRVRAGGGADDPDVRRPDARPRGGVAAVRHLRHRRNALRGGLQHHPALFASYNGPLYQVQRASDNSTLNIGLQAAGGIVNSAPQVSFCSGTTCTITELYDQTSNGNNMPISPGSSCSGCGSSLNGPARAAPTSARTRWRCP